MKILFVLLIAIVGSSTAHAQCDKTIRFTSEKHGRMLADSTLEEERELPAIFTVSADSVTIELTTPDGPMLVKCKVNSRDCKMANDYSSGTLEIEAGCVRTFRGNSRDGEFRLTVETLKDEVRFFAERKQEDGSSEHTRFFIVEKQVKLQ